MIKAAPNPCPHCGRYDSAMPLAPLNVKSSAGSACSISPWTHVDDRLPAPDDINGEFADVLVWGPGVTRPVMCYWDGDRWIDRCDDEWLTGITHWMPLPEIPAK